MSADNFLFVRLNGTVEERSDSNPELSSPAIYTGTDQDDAEQWAECELERREEQYTPVEYGIVVEEREEGPFSDPPEYHESFS